MKKISIILIILTLIITTLVPISASASSVEGTAGRVKIESGYLNVRSSPSATSKVLSTVQKHSYLTLISKSNGWWYVQYSKDGFGYCSATYITEIGSKQSSVNISSGYLNVRSGPSSSYSKIDSLSKGQNVIVISTSGNWSYILYNGIKTGYVSSYYLTTSKAEIKLNIPDFKQTDSRWANTKIGSTGKTISQIGCATTTIAMSESYRTGTTIYPNTMSKQLKYTSSGSVYWPSRYKTVSNSSGYLTEIYNKLKEGKPVIFGAKTSSGGQHWVVITGYNGGNTLTASGFTINDPGSTKRTNLAQLLNVYPRFYKFLYY
ncbi:MAG: SH3 domain-containing protein [Clostridia bacterium]|nr:SH3 domain-containing protein [Clostridia bacterium]MBO5913104.1 SH3 domain-containing protein [Clostridia bacterium]